MGEGKERGKEGWGRWRGDRITEEDATGLREGVLGIWCNLENCDLVLVLLHFSTQRFVSFFPPLTLFPPSLTPSVSDQVEASISNNKRQQML